MSEEAELKAGTTGSVSKISVAVRLQAALICTLVAAVFVLTPPLGVAKPLPRAFLHQAQYIFYAICLIAAFLTGFAVEPARMAAWLRPRTLSAWNERLGYLTYFSLYLTSALLCMRMKLALFGAYELFYPIAYFGLVLTVIGSWLFIKGLNGLKLAKIAYPHYLGVIIGAIGLALSHLTWFPLAAIPGILVFMKWRIEKLEALQDPMPEGVTAPRYKIIPFVF